MASNSQFGIFSILVLIILLEQNAIRADNTENNKLKESISIIKSNCRNKFTEITPERAKRIHDGEMPQDKAGKCYLNCILNMIGIMHRGRFNYEVTKNLIANVMPKEVQGEYQSAINRCKGVAANNPDPCSVATEIYYCFKRQIKNFDLI